MRTKDDRIRRNEPACGDRHVEPSRRKEIIDNATRHTHENAGMENLLHDSTPNRPRLIVFKFGLDSGFHTVSPATTMEGRGRVD